MRDKKRDQIKYIIKLCLKNCLKVFWIFPIKKKKVFFMSTMGKSYSCNPKYLYEEMLRDKRFNSYFFIWCFKKPEEIQELPLKNNLMVKKGNYIKYFYYLLTSQIIIYNCGGISYAPIRKKQLLIETWHGSPFKKGGLTQSNKSDASKKGVVMACMDIKLFLTHSKHQTEFAIRNSFGYRGEILECGCPRNDIFFNYTCDDVIRIRRKIFVNKDMKLVLYAPTFRGTEHKATNLTSNYEVINPKQVKSALSAKYGTEWIFATRGHQYGGDLKLEGADLDLSFYPDMQELLLVADVLITDYSSSIWDFALTKKPSYLFVPDVECFENNERGFFTPIDTWPGTIAKSNEELVIRIHDYSQEDYETKIEHFLKESQSYENGTACKQVLTWILNRAK